LGFEPFPACHEDAPGRAPGLAGFRVEAEPVLPVVAIPLGDEDRRPVFGVAPVGPAVASRTVPGACPSWGGAVQRIGMKAEHAAGREAEQLQTLQDNIGIISESKYLYQVVESFSWTTTSPRRRPCP